MKVNARAIALSFFSLFSLGLLDNARGPFYPEILKEFSLTGVPSALIFAIPSACAFFAAQGAGLLSVSGRGGVRWASVIMGAGFLMLALAPHRHWLWAACVVFGVGFGMINVYQHQLVQEAAPPTRWSRLFSGLHCFYALSAGIAPALVSLFIVLNLDWRSGFVIFSAVPLILFGLTFFVHETKEISTQAEPFPNLSGYVLVTWFGLGVAFYVSAELLITTRLVLFLRSDFDFTAAGASLFLAAFFALLFISRLFFTFYEVSRLRQSILGLVLMAGLSNWAALRVHSIFFPVTALFFAPLFPFMMGLVSELFPSFPRRATAFAVSLGSLLVVPLHLLVGHLTETQSLRSAMNLGPMALAVSFLIWLTIPEPPPHRS